MNKVASPSEWIALWAVIDPNTVGKKLSLNDYSILVNAEKSKWFAAGFSTRSISNRRYVVHLEDALERGLDVPREYLAGIDPARDLAFDWYGFPNLRAALAAAGIVEPKEWVETEARLEASRKAVAA